jgi:geranylgeranyl pyrophosphate synthase
VEEALSALEPLGPHANPLREIARFILEREY